MDLVKVLTDAVHRKASDIHLVIGRPPMARIMGEIVPLSDAPPLLSEEMARTIDSILSESQRERFETSLELDFSFQVSGVARFRVNVLMATNGMEAVFRVIPARIPTPDELHLTPAMIRLAALPRGLVLVTGPTGTGKSTTLASLIELVNQQSRKHIITIEDPIEFVYEGKQSIIRQREVGQHTRSFQEALKRCLRQDPNLILVGEMRDLETIAMAITAAETGHLCFATLHTSDAPQTIDRIIDVFPPHQQQQVRVQLSTALAGIISQVLLPRANRQGRIAARELLVMTPAVSNLIREGKTHMIYSAIDTGAKFGMISLDRALAELVRSGVVTLEEAVGKARNPEALRGGGGGGGGITPGGSVMPGGGAGGRLARQP